jgi:hypothetical protein
LGICKQKTAALAQRSYQPHRIGDLHQPIAAIFVPGGEPKPEQTWRKPNWEEGGWIRVLANLSVDQDGSLIQFDRHQGLSNHRLWPVLPAEERIYIGTKGSVDILHLGIEFYYK